MGEGGVGVSLEKSCSVDCSLLVHKLEQLVIFYQQGSWRLRRHGD
jgi:hypothetical protein